MSISARRKSNFDFSELKNSLEKMERAQKYRAELNHQKSWAEEYAWRSHVLNSGESITNRAIVLAIKQRKHMFVLENILPRINDEIFKEYPKSLAFIKKANKKNAQEAIEELSDSYLKAAIKFKEELDREAVEQHGGCIDPDHDDSYHEEYCEYCAKLFSYYEKFSHSPEELKTNPEFRELGFLPCLRRGKPTMRETKLEAISHFISSYIRAVEDRGFDKNSKLGKRGYFFPTFDSAVYAMCDVLVVFATSETDEIRADL